MTKAFSWIQIQPSEYDRLLSDPVAEVVPRASGLYVWRLNVVPPESTRGSTRIAKEWVSAVSRRPFGVLKNRAIAANALASISLGGGGLTPDKEQNLDRILSSRRFREQVVGFTAQLQKFAPVLYVGQTLNLYRRVLQHLRGETDFTSIWLEQSGLAVTDLCLEYFVVGEVDDIRLQEYLELLEMICQRVLAPLGVSRSG